MGKSLTFNRELFRKIDFTKPWAWLATWFGCGLAIPAPGTWGTIGGIPFAAFALLAGGWKYLLAWLIVVFLVGWWAAEQFEKATGEHDASAIVIDEVAGIAMTMLVALPTVKSVTLAFLFFRFFDILKPWPVSYLDKKIGRGLGVMVDDLAAAVYAGLCLWGLRHAGFG
jgi:phosphatidylglycerophosphatase A